MKLKLDHEPYPFHTEFSTCVSWNNPEEVFSTGDDHTLMRWDINSNSVSKVLDLPPDLFPIKMEWPRKKQGVSGKKSADLLLLIASDGNFYLLGRGRIERTVSAHKGAILSGSWNIDGTEILTSGEDGAVRIWSRSGNLRSTLCQNPIPIYASAWAPDPSSIVYGQGSTLVLKPTALGSKGIQWKGHEGLIISIACSSSSIVSGSEDGRYKVWDVHGKVLFVSHCFDHPITSIAWSQRGDLFTVGSFNSITLADRFGWAHCIEKPEVGSIYGMEWSSDGTRLAAIASSGFVLIGSLIERNFNWKSLDVDVVHPKEMIVSEFNENTMDRIEFKERIIKVSVNYGYIIVITQSQVYIYNYTSIHVPVNFELREQSFINLILQSNKSVILCGGLLISIYTYEGKLQGSIKWPGMRADLLDPNCTAISPDTVGFVDQNDQRLLRLFDPNSGKLLSELRMETEMREIAFAANTYTTLSSPRMLAILDKNDTLRLSLIKSTLGGSPEEKKLSSGVGKIIWHAEHPILATLKENKLRIFYFPQVSFIDESLIEFTSEDKEPSELSSSISGELISFQGSRLSIRRSDGILFTIPTSPFASNLHILGSTGKFDEAIKMCRYINEKLVWGIVAGFAALRGNLNMAELCYSEIGLFDKALFIQNLKSIKGDSVNEKFQTALISGGITDSEGILIQNGKIDEAIKLNIELHRWERALELSIKHKNDPEKVLKQRSDFLSQTEIQETLTSFQNYQTHVKMKKDKEKSTKEKAILNSDEIENVSQEVF